MKKSYITPQTEVCQIESTQSILAGSALVGPGSTGEQNSREFIMDEDWDIFSENNEF